MRALIANKLCGEANTFPTLKCFLLNPKDPKQTKLIEIPLDLFEDKSLGLLKVNTSFRQVLLLFHSIQNACHTVPIGMLANNTDETEAEPVTR